MLNIFQVYCHEIGQENPFLENRYASYVFEWFPPRSLEPSAVYIFLLSEEAQSAHLSLPPCHDEM